MLRGSPTWGRLCHLLYMLEPRTRVLGCRGRCLGSGMCLGCMKALGTCRARRCPPLEGGVVCVVPPDRHEGGRKSESTLIFSVLNKQERVASIPYHTQRSRGYGLEGEFGQFPVPASDEEGKEHLQYSLCMVHTRCCYRHYDIQFDKLVEFSARCN